MSHAYPLARTARTALSPEVKVARTRYEAEDLAEDVDIKALETEWLTPSAKDLPGMLRKVDASPAHGFVQHYEDAEGNTVLAITYWKLSKSKVAARKIAPKPKPKVEKSAEAETDHTDDLYFRHGRTKKRGRKIVPNPNQFDLFDTPAAKPDPSKD